MEERVPHIYRFPDDGGHQWMCPSRKKGFVWVLIQKSFPTSWGDSHVTWSLMLMPIEDWQAQGAVLDEREEQMTANFGPRSPLHGWGDISRWP